MAYYDYFCDKCKKPFEIQCGINDDRSGVRCGHCDSDKIRRVFDSILVPKKVGSGKKAAAASGGSSCSSCASHNCGSCH
jgi:putative FmdB family regulatory protein